MGIGIVGSCTAFLAGVVLLRLFLGGYFKEKAGEKGEFWTFRHSIAGVAGGIDYGGLSRFRWAKEIAALDSDMHLDYGGLSRFRWAKEIAALDSDMHLDYGGLSRFRWAKEIAALDSDMHLDLRRSRRA
jgi:hypothetical protein